MQSDEQLFTIGAGLRMLWSEIYEAYLMQFAQTYSNESLERKFVLNSGKDKVVFNERIRDNFGNVVGIRNDVSLLKNIRHKVIIDETQQSPTQKVELLALISELIKSIPPQKIATIQFLSTKAVGLIEQFDQEDRSMLDAIGQKELDYQLSQLELETEQIKANIKRMNTPDAPPIVPPPKITMNYQDISPEAKAEAEVKAGLKMPPQAAPTPQGGPGGPQPSPGVPSMPGMPGGQPPHPMAPPQHQHPKNVQPAPMPAPINQMPQKAGV